MYITPIYQVPLRQPWYHIMQFFLLYAHACACTRMHRLYIAPAESIHGYAALVHQAFVFSLYIAASILHLLMMLPALCGSCLLPDLPTLHCYTCRQSSSQVGLAGSNS